MKNKATYVVSSFRRDLIQAGAGLGSPYGVTSSVRINNVMHITGENTCHMCKRIWSVTYRHWVTGWESKIKTEFPPALLKLPSARESLEKMKIRLLLGGIRFNYSEN